MDIRRRMLFKKEASSSGGGGSTTGGSYTVNLNSQWEATTAVPNPDSTLYDGVYRSSSNYNVNSGAAIMYITIKDCSSFKMYIRSYAESNYDYVMVSQLDKTITGSSSYSDTTLVKAYTRGNQQSGTALSNYTLVEFTGISSGEHTITVVYRKDGSVNKGDDRGYVLIEKLQAGSGDSGGGEDIIPEPIINIDNYLTIEALENGLTASLSTNACEYCVDGDGNWKSLTAGAVTKSINNGHTLSFRGNLTPVKNVGVGTFTISKKCNLSGKCASMLYGDNAANNYSISSKTYAFYMLFTNNNTIIDASRLELPTDTSNYCYNAMFYQCRNLIGVPTLGTSTSLGCYNSMFRECDRLVVPPVLPATVAASGCYKRMFQDCPSLLEAPELPAMGINEQCYQYMFYGCTSLTTAPELPATALASNCYDSMFYNCSKLNYIKMLATNMPASNCLYYWVNGVAPTGTFVKNSAMNSLPIGESGIPTGWTVVNDGEPVIDINYLTIEALEDGLTASLSTNACEYCVDGDGNWKSLAAATATESINSGHTLSFRGNLTPNSSNGIGKFTISKKCNLKGNCMSMLFGDNAAANFSLSGKNYAFYCLFYNCKNIISISENFLPASTLSTYCYAQMFYGCSNLTQVPSLPATSLASRCYEYMFGGCTKITTAPTLPARTLVSYCYYHMFDGCTSLTATPTISATTVANDCCSYMFSGCINLITASALSARTLKDYCYYYMFNGCKNLTQAPILSATTLANHCCRYMFYGCSNLTSAPELLATSLKDYCYYYMFNGCNKLNYIKMLATNISASNCLTDWTTNVSSTGTFVKNPSMNSLPTGTSGIPSGWTVVNNGEEDEII